jgi:transcriptional regulator with XRE-family HTH domain
VDNEENVAMGQRIRKARIRADLTQEDLGRKLGYEQGTISAYERGKVDGITLGVLMGIAKATRQPLSFLIGDAPRIAVSLAEVLRQEHPDIEEGTLREIQAFVSWAVYRDRQVRNAGNAPSDETSRDDTGDSTQSEASA